MTLIVDVLCGLALLAAIAARLRAGRHARAVVEEDGVLVDGNTNSDETYHLAYIDAIRANHHRLPKRFPQFVGPGQIAYPGAYHWVLSFLPDRAIAAIARHGALAGDLLLGGSVSALLTEDAHVTTGAALALAALYLVSPALTLVNIGPRSFHLTPRLPSQLLYGSIIVIVLATHGRPSLGLLLLVVVLLASMLLTSKFSLQVMLFSTPVLMVSGRPLVALGCVTTAAALATIISRGFFARQVRAQLEHLEWYVKRQREHMVRACRWRELWRRLSSGDVRGTVQGILVENPLTAGLIRHLHVIALTAWLIAAQPSLGAARSAALAFTVAGSVGWIATSGGFLRVLGESERYLEFALPATWFLFWSLPRGGALVLAILLAALYEVVLYVGNFSVLRRRRPYFVGLRRDLRDVLERVSAAGGGTALFVDVTDAYAVHAYKSVRAAMYNGSPSLRGDSRGFFDWFFLRYPLVDPSHMDEIIGRYAVDTVIERRHALSQAGSRSPAFTRLQRRFANPSYVVYSVSERARVDDRQPGESSIAAIAPDAARPAVNPLDVASHTSMRETSVWSRRRGRRGSAASASAASSGVADRLRPRTA